MVQWLRISCQTRDRGISNPGVAIVYENLAQNFSGMSVLDSRIKVRERPSNSYVRVCGELGNFLRQFRADLRKNEVRILHSRDILRSIERNQNRIEHCRVLLLADQAFQN